MPNKESFKPIRGLARLNPADELSRGLIGAWIFDGTGTRTINNFANESGLGTATMQTAPSWSGSRWGTALKFNPATSDYALIPNFTGFRPTTYPFSIACRVLINGTSAIWTNDDVVNRYAGITLAQDSSVGIFNLRLGDGQTIGSTHRKDFLTSVAEPNGEFISVAFNVFSISSFQAFTQGKNNTGGTSGTASTLAYYSSGTLYGSMGREDVSTASGYSYYSDHTIDYIYFWSGRALTSEDVLRLHVDPYDLFVSRSRSMFFVTAPASGWPHKLNAISNASISKICGVSKASISKVSGVA